MWDILFLINHAHFHFYIHMAWHCNAWLCVRVCAIRYMLAMGEGKGAEEEQEDTEEVRRTLCAVHAVADRLRSVWLTYLR